MAGGSTDGQPRRVWTRDECRALLREQLAEAFAAAGEALVTCACGRQAPLWLGYRCYFCGLWFCPACARAHFGERPQHVEATHDET